MESQLSTAASLRSEGPRNGVLKLVIAGRLDADSTGRIWRESTRSVAAARAATVDLDASAIDYCDGAGIALLIQLRRLQRRTVANWKFMAYGRSSRLLDDWSRSAVKPARASPQLAPRLAEEIGQDAAKFGEIFRID